MDNPAGGKTGWGEVETVELVGITRPVLAAMADDVGPSTASRRSIFTYGQRSCHCIRIVRRPLARS
jgi:hypothetical protein